MEYEMKKAILLAENMRDFINFVQKQYEKNSTNPNKDKFYQIKLITEDFRFQILTDELLRINQFDWDEKYSHYLVDSFTKGLDIIDEYVKRNYEDLYIFAARIYTLRNLSQAFSKRDS